MFRTIFVQISKRLSAGRPERSTGGLAHWLLGRLGNAERPRPRLALVERITLAPRQTLSLVEVEGRRILVATSADGAPALLPLDSVAPCTYPRRIPRRTAARRTC